MKSAIYIRLSALLLIAAVASLLAFSCVEMPDPRGNLPDKGGVIPVQGDTGPNPPHYAAFIATTDFALTGGYGVIDINTLAVYSPDPITASEIVSPDPVAKTNGDYVYVINRFTYDNISVLTKRFDLVRQYSVKSKDCSPANPHDMEFAGDTVAYLSRYECRDLWKINPVTGQKLGSIDLTSAGYGGVDGIPEMSGMLLLGDTLYVAVQMMDRRTWRPEGPGVVVMVDTVTDTVVGDITLTGKNPVTDLQYSPDLDRILVATAGSYNSIGDGGIESIDYHAGVSEGYLIDETSLAGNVGDFEVASAIRGYATVTTSGLDSILVGFDPVAGTRDGTPIYSAKSGFALWDIGLADNGDLYICDRNATRPGVIIVDTLSADAVITPEPIDLGFPPFSIVFLK